MIRSIQQGLLADGIMVPLTKLCVWFGVPRRTVYYKPTKAAPKVDPRFANPIKEMIESEPSFGYRTVAWLLGFNKNTVQRIFQIKGWQVRKRPIGMRPRIEAVPSVATAPNERPLSAIDTIACRATGPRTFAASGQGAMAGPLWLWSSTAIPVNSWAGICRGLANRPRRQVPWNTR
jgi:hypothetical protein